MKLRDFEAIEFKILKRQGSFNRSWERRESVEKPIWLRFIRNLLDGLSEIFPEFCLRYALDMPEMCLRYAWHIPEICLIYTSYMPEIFLLYVWVFLKLFWYLSEICLKYARNMTDAFHLELIGNWWNTLKLCCLYTPIMLKSEIWD